jgi:hypothetical protein
MLFFLVAVENNVCLEKIGGNGLVYLTMEKTKERGVQGDLLAI